MPTDRRTRLRLAITALIFVAVFASPCAWDTHPRDAAATSPQPTLQQGS